MRPEPSADLLERHNGLPVLDAEAVSRNPDDPRYVLVRTVKCPFCGHRHTHGEDADVAVGTLTHRAAHCPTWYRGTMRKIERPDGGYYLRIVANRFLKPRKGAT